MTNDTKAEIVLVAVAAVALLWLWHNNTAATGDSGVSQFPSLNLGKPGAVPGPTLFTIPAPVPGYDPTINLPSWSLPGFSLPMAAGLPSSCNCAGSPDQAFGSQSTMAAWLNGALDATDISSEAANWF